MLIWACFASLKNKGQQHTQLLRAFWNLHGFVQIEPYRFQLYQAADQCVKPIWSCMRQRPCLVELWLWEKAAVGCELWKSCCGLWAVEKLKAVWLNKYKIYLLSLSLLKQLWKNFLFHQFRKAESQKPKAGSNQLSKLYYGKAATSEKSHLKKQPLWLGFWLLGPKAKAKSPTKQTLILLTLHPYM